MSQRDELYRDFARRDMDARHERARSAESLQRNRDFHANAEGLAWGEGFATSGLDSHPTHNEIRGVRKQLSKEIEDCELVDKPRRLEFASCVRAAHPTGGVPALPFERLIAQFREIVRASHPTASADRTIADHFELRMIAQELLYLRDRARAPRR